MHTYNEMKQRFIDHLAEMDLRKMDMADLSAYSAILGTLYETEREDFATAMAKIMAETGYRNGKAEVTENG